VDRFANPFPAATRGTYNGLILFFTHALTQTNTHSFGWLVHVVGWSVGWLVDLMNINEGIEVRSGQEYVTSVHKPQLGMICFNYDIFYW